MFDDNWSTSSNKGWCRIGNQGWYFSNQTAHSSVMAGNERGLDSVDATAVGMTLLGPIEGSFCCSVIEGGLLKSNVWPSQAAPPD